jgi:membrane-bound lytic murein transglycosylase F
VATVKEQLVTRADDQVKSVDELVGREIAVQKSTSFWGTVQKLVKQYPGIQVRTIPEDYSVEEIIDAVARRKLDVTVADSNLLKALLPSLDAIKVPLDLSGERPVAWAVRPNATKLKHELDVFLNQERLTFTDHKRYKADLPQIKQHKVLRVLTRNNASTYFLWRGELMGFEYELAKEFARLHDLRLEMVVAPSRTALFTWLREGRGDMIAASLTIMPQQEDLGIKYSRGYNKMSQEVVTRKDDNSLHSVEDLRGRTVYVRQSSSYWRDLSELLNKGIEFKLQAVPESMETEEIIEKVASGEYDLTVADSNILDIELAWREDEIKAAFELGGTVSHGWVVRDDQPELLKAINAFVKKEYRGLFYNLAHEKYFQEPGKIKQRLEERVDSAQGGSLSPYDDLARKYAEQHGFDWRMIVAQMYQESRYNPRAKSWTGARGLMQIMPRTARQMGISDLNKPANGIKAGVTYLDWLRDRFEPELPVKDRMWFALAAYNAGAGHVKDARRLAEQLGLSPNHWFDNVEKAMLLLSRRKYARKATHGYVRGIEPVNYVRQIRDRYEAYVRLTNPLKEVKQTQP